MSIFEKVEKELYSLETKLGNTEKTLMDELMQHIDDLDKIERVKRKSYSSEKDYDIDFKLSDLKVSDSYSGKFIRSGRYTGEAKAVIYLYGERCPLFVIRDNKEEFSFWTAYMNLSMPGWNFDLGQKIGSLTLNDSEEKLRDEIKNVLPKLLEWRKNNAN
jgi:hypothetical protein